MQKMNRTDIFINRKDAILTVWKFVFIARCCTHFLPLTSECNNNNNKPPGTLYFHSHIHLAPSPTHFFSSIHWFSFVQKSFTFTDKTCDTRNGTDFQQKIDRRKERKKQQECILLKVKTTNGISNVLIPLEKFQFRNCIRFFHFLHV